MNHSTKKKKVKMSVKRVKYCTDSTLLVSFLHYFKKHWNLENETAMGNLGQTLNARFVVLNNDIVNCPYFGIMCLIIKLHKKK